MQHPSGIPEKIVNKVVARRGRLHAFETIEPATTALVVIDLDEATVAHDGTWPRIIANVNTLAAAVRETGGVVAWVLSRMHAMPKHFRAILGDDLATRYFNDGHENGAGTSQSESTSAAWKNAITTRSTMRNRAARAAGIA